MAGFSNTIGSSNTLVGSFSNVSANNLTNATAIGSGAIVGTSNTVVLGRSADNVEIPGTLNVTGGTTFGGTLGANILNATTQFNIGGDRILAGPAGDNVFAGRTAGLNNTSGIRNSFLGNQAGEANIGGIHSSERDQG